MRVIKAIAYETDKMAYGATILGLGTTPGYLRVHHLGDDEERDILARDIFWPRPTGSMEPYEIDYPNNESVIFNVESEILAAFERPQAGDVFHENKEWFCQVLAVDRKYVHVLSTHPGVIETYTHKNWAIRYKRLWHRMSPLRSTSLTKGMVFIRISLETLCV